MKKEKWQKEEWGGWKIVSKMLDNPNEIGIYPASECYEELYDFVVAQKKKAVKKERARVEMLIVDEINTARREGEKTSRLTSLFNKNNENIYNWRHSWRLQGIDTVS